MRITVAIAVAALTLGFAGLAIGQDDPIKARIELMKTLGPDIKAVVEMIRGDTKFDGAIAEKAMLKIADHATTLPTLFPEGSDVGSDALPLIWTEFDQFKAIYAKLGTDAQAGAKAAAANDFEGLKAAFSAVGADCQACHEKYRKSG
jgi:cytochrome c556